MQTHLKKVEKKIVILKKKREECNLLQQPTIHSEKLFRNSQSATAKLKEKFEEDRIYITEEDNRQQTDHQSNQLDRGKISHCQ